jgi:hypothetical protein
VTTGATPNRPVVAVRRVYAAADPGDGHRVLVDRLWPRGVAKGDAAIDEWPKDAAPSTELRRWYGHEVSGSPSSPAGTVRNCRARRGPPSSTGSG